MNRKFTPFNTLAITIVTASVTVGGLALAYKPIQEPYIPVYQPSVVPSEYGISTLVMTSETEGRAVINLDGFSVHVPFTVEAFQDSYGVPGSEFTAVEVQQLGEIKVFDANGNPYNDFTDHVDHYNINLLIKGYIEKHRLVEAA